ncbi:hypothetical protein F0U61_02685 [Archangium violaceum]|uniref:hypothetical protein n=1 Tax=Archangium violaceum TaxID=83451 RepID=UPI002B2FCC56|nr:hypothetical protein F0U61_02685 [Archangium violaceum]
MSSNKFSRFMHLERARGDKTAPGGQVRLQNGGRFESVAGPGSEVPSSVAVPEAHVERFKLHGQTPLALDDTPAQGQDFPRCMRCQTENGRFTRECVTCGADLQAPEQLAYNQERWRAQEQAEAQTREQMKVLQKIRQEDDAEQLAERQRYVEELHRALEKDRLFISKLQPLFTPCLGVGLLRLIPHPLARWMTLAWTILLPLLLVRFGNDSLQVLGLYLGMLIIVIFVPTGLWTAGRRGRGWHW